MSMHIVVVSIEGNHLVEISEVLQKCRYVIEKTLTVRTGKQASRELAWNPDGQHVAKAAYFANGWTFILDPELVLMTNAVWLEYSKKWKARVVAWLCEGTSASYGLTLFQSGKKSRQIVSVDGNVVVNEGKPLPEESGVDWSEATEETILGIAERIGAKYDFPANREHTVFQLNESQMSDS
jgi:hypothetical protein